MEEEGGGGVWGLDWCRAGIGGLLPFSCFHPPPPPRAIVHLY